MAHRGDGVWAEDREWLRRSRAGEGGFDAFYTRHRATLLAFFAQRTRDPEATADLTAETFAAALIAVQDRSRQLPEWPAAWLFTIAHRKLLDSIRRGRVERESRRRLGLERLEIDDEDIARIDELAGSTDVALDLAKALPPEQFEALSARVLQERDYTEIAEALGCSQPVARKRVSRALASLRTSMESLDD
jgi:RNA polymerase sigma factor (sigma-70 family)